MLTVYRRRLMATWFHHVGNETAMAEPVTTAVPNSATRYETSTLRNARPLTLSKPCDPSLTIRSRFQHVVRVVVSLLLRASRRSRQP